jgi:hypothetical protein
MDNSKFIHVECNKDECSKDDLIILAIASYALAQVQDAGYKSALFDACIYALDATGYAVEAALIEDCNDENN